jgi:hypothetical protein
MSSMGVLSASFKAITVNKPDMPADRKIVTPAEARKLQAAEVCVLPCPIFCTSPSPLPLITH